ncbi:MAG: hypothetical protein PHF63_09525 [Herbinix sp.]|nr:hypothetical protein [Herbinix sp.]
MDMKHEDTMVRQIEENLTNNMNDNLFLTGRTVENNKISVKNNNSYNRAEEVKNSGEERPDYPLFSNDYIINSTGLTRAEYIREAREACLRQLSATQLYGRPYDVNYMEADSVSNEQLNHKRAKVMKMFHNGAYEDNKKREENTVQEVGAYRSLIIRSVLAIVLFLSIFAFDKFDLKIGNVTNKTIQEYVTGNDALQDLENILVTWLK